MKKSSISKASTDEEMGEYWDTHELPDEILNGPEVEFEFVYSIPIKKELFQAIEEEARKHGAKPEELVNLWLEEKLAEQH